MSRKLFINTTITKKAIVSLFENSNLLAQEEADEPLNAIDKLLKKINLRLENIDEIDSHPGPGSFTGIRIGSVVAQTLNFALGKKVKRKELKYD